MIKGSGCNNDGRGDGPMTPRPEGQMEAMARAHRQTEFPVESIGLVEVLAAAGDKVEVRAERIARANSDEAAKQLLQEVQIKEDVGADGIRLETVLPRGGGFRRHGEVKYHVRVPASVSVHVRNTNGQVRIDGVKGDVHAQSEACKLAQVKHYPTWEFADRLKGSGVTINAMHPGDVNAARVGERAPYQTPSAYAARIARSVPGQREDLHTLTALYLRARYADDPMGPDEARAAQSALVRLQETPVIQSPLTEE